MNASLVRRGGFILATAAAGMVLVAPAAMAQQPTHEAASAQQSAPVQQVKAGQQVEVVNNLSNQEDLHLSMQLNGQDKDMNVANWTSSGAITTPLDSDGNATMTGKMTYGDWGAEIDFTIKANQDGSQHVTFSAKRGGQDYGQLDDFDLPEAAEHTTGTDGMGLGDVSLQMMRCYDQQGDYAYTFLHVVSPH